MELKIIILISAFVSAGFGSDLVESENNITDPIVDYYSKINNESLEQVLTLIKLGNFNATEFINKKLTDIKNDLDKNIQSILKTHDQNMMKEFSINSEYLRTRIVNTKGDITSEIKKDFLDLTQMLLEAQEFENTNIETINEILKVISVAFFFNSFSTILSLIFCVIFFEKLYFSSDSESSTSSLEKIKNFFTERIPNFFKSLPAKISAGFLRCFSCCKKSKTGSTFTENESASNSESSVKRPVIFTKRSDQVGNVYMVELEEVPNNSTPLLLTPGT